MKSAAEINAALNAITEEVSKNNFSITIGIQYATHHEIFIVGEVTSCLGLVELQKLEAHKKIRA